MTQRQRSIADGLVDGRYRLDKLVYKTTSASFHEVTHRNGSTAWLKMPIAPANGPGIALEASLVNTLPSALALRDDGIDERGLPYLVIDPLAGGELLAEMCARGRAGKREPVERVLAVGNAVITAVASIASAKHALPSIELDEVVVLPTGEVALLGLDRVVPLDAASQARGVGALSRLLRMVVVEHMEVTPGTEGASIFDAAGPTHADLDAFQVAWRKTARTPLPEVRRRVPSTESSPKLTPSAGPPPLPPLKGLATPASIPPLTPLAVVIPAEARSPEPDESSVMAYLRSGENATASIPPPSTKGEMYDPLARVHEMPRVVQASLRPPSWAGDESKSPRAKWLAIGGGIAAAAAFAIGITIALGDKGDKSDKGHATAPPIAVAPAPAIVDTPVTKAAAASIAAATATAVAENASPPAPAPAPARAASESGPTTGKLRSDGAPPGRKIYVDGELVGEAPLDVDLPCGKHTVRAGVKNEARPFHIVCGAERVIRFNQAGSWTVK